VNVHRFAAIDAEKEEAKPSERRKNSGHAAMLASLDWLVNFGWKLRPNVQANRRAALTLAKLKPHTGPSG